jgi:hypothetical protein
MERFYVNLPWFKKDREKDIGVSFTPNASAHLKVLVERPNPLLSEFMFICLGKNGLIDKIMVASENEYMGRGLTISGVHKSSVDRSEWLILLNKFKKSDRVQDIVALGHLHPTGSRVIGGIKYTVSPSEALLFPSTGGPNLGITNGGDLLFFKKLHEHKTQIPTPYVAIAAKTQNGQTVRFYDLEKIIKVKKYRDIDKVPQVTINL